MPRRSRGSATSRHKLVLEITERGVPDQMGLHALDLAARQGVRIALDDVRIDPASVMVLSRCNAQIIKIDKSVLLDNGADGTMPRWAEALSVLLKTTDLEVIAEGVETAEQLALLRAAGVRQVQGHYFSRPFAGGCISGLLQSVRLSVPNSPTCTTITPRFYKTWIDHPRSR